VVALEKEKIKNSHLEHALTIIHSEEEHEDKRVKEQLDQLAHLKMEFIENQN
jgi:hypothetical protein